MTSLSLPARTLAARHQIADLQRRFPLLQVAALVVLYLVGALTVPGWTLTSTTSSMLVMAGLLGLAGAGQTIVVLGGGIDFSVGSFITAGAVSITELTSVDHWPMWAAIACPLAVGAFGGTLNGVISYWFGIEPLIVTLGVGALLTGVLTGWVSGAVSGTPPAWTDSAVSVASKTFGLSVPPVVVIWAAVAVIIGIVLARTRPGRSLYLNGTNPSAARLALVRTGWTWTAGFIVSAMLATFVGMLLAGNGGSNLTSGDPYLFQALTAVIVGGTMFGGRGDYWRTVLGALILTVVTYLLEAHNYSIGVQEMVYGVLIMIVVAVYGRERKIRDRV
ncbi:MAG TPA: ABC transporter permease [Streptosporangiaceae bacterium]|jgi:ribose transport system permease protein